MQPRGQCDTGVDAGSHDTALKRAEPGRPGRGRVRSLAARGLAGLLAAIVAALVALPLQAQAQTTPNDCPADTDWCATLQVGYLSTGNDPKNEVWGYRRDAQEDYGDLSQVMFSHGGINYTVAYLYRLKTTFGGITTLSDDLHLDVGLLDLPDDTVLQLGSRTFTVDAGSDNVTPGQEKWNLQGNPLVWIAEQHVTVSLKFPSPPTAAGVTVSKTALTVTEEDATGGSYTVVLDTQPMADVVVTVAGYAGTDVTPAPTTLTFTTLNWEMAQTVTVTAGNDANTANETVSLTHSATSTDTDYSGITIAGVTVTVTDNDTANAAPAFTSAATFDAAENQTAVGTVVASDSDTDDSVTGYAIQGGADASTFSIVPATGVLTFASAPNFEAPADADTDNGYVVVMRATSGTGARVKTADQTITVTVTDVAGEAPGVPAAPLVSAASVTSVTAAWTTPANAGPPITDYDYRYRVTSPQGAWTEVTGTTITALGATITGLAEDTGYDVQVRATTDEGTSGWSASGSGSTDANAAPTFTSAATFDAAENQTAVGTVQASDSDTDDTVTGYAIQGGADRSTFSIVETTGVLTFASAPNFEAPADADTDNAYVVVVRATSGTGDRAKTADQTITVTVTDVAGEAPGVPDAPMVTAASATSVTAAWTAPANAGPPITDYDYRYRVTAPQGPWTEVTTTAITGLSATITGLAEDTGYDVQVRATTDEGTSGWSASGSGSTDANAAPTFTSAATFDAAENQTAVGTVQASDSDTDDTVTGYAIQGGADRSTFSIVETTGVLTFASAPNFEAPADADTDNAYVVVVRATSGTGDRAKTADQTITVTVTDVAGEAPGVPDAPMVTAASATSVTAAWTAPANAGPPITDYDYRYRVTAPQGPWTEVTTTAITGLSATITGLAEDTEYDVQVRATTDEGTSGWSGSGSGSTNANNTPATGQPTISGVAQVGSLLTAGKGTIADVNGTTKADNGDSGYAYTYQWIRVDGGTETNISGATSSTYTPVDDDEGKKIKVRVSFQDDADHSESRTSAATVAVTVEDNDTAQVTGVTIAEGNAQLVVRWTAVDNATGYTVQWKSDLQENYNTGDRQARVTPGSTTSHTISGLANDTEYTVQVGANRTGAPDGQWSVEMPGKPVMPTGAGVTVSKTALTVTEEDATGGSYTVVLDTQPTADVTVTVAGHAGTDVTPAPATLLFMTATWNVAQTVTVTAANDADTANDTVTLTHSAASTDADYSAITIADVAVTVEDNDTALAVTVTPGDAQLVVAWTAVDTATGYTVQWKSDSGATRVTVTPGSTRRYTIRGLTNDTEYTVQVIANRTGASDVPSAEVTGKPAPPTKAGVTVSKTALTVTEEDATGGSYTVVLDTQPTADVTVTVAGHAGTDVTPAPATLLFMTATWNVAQTVTVTAANDADTANDTVTLTHSAASTDADYSAITIADVAVTVEDNDTALAVTVTPGDAQLVVAWTAVDTATGYTVQWKSDSGATRVTVTPGSTRRYTIRGLTNDTEYTVQVIANRTGASDVPSAEVTGKPAPPTKAGVTVSKTALTVTEEDATGGSYTVVLDTQPTADVTVTVAGHAGTDVTPAPATLLFMTATWNVAQTVTVTAANDADTANDTVTLTHSAASTDADYSAITIADVAVTVEDNDTALAVTVTPGDAQLVVAWTAVDTATGYTVQWKSDSGATRVTVTPGSTRRYTIRGLTNDTEYTVRVIANRTGASDVPSSEVTGTPESPGSAQQRAALAPLAARFVSVPPEHDGTTEFWLELTFDAPVAKGSRRHIRALLGATGGTVTRLRRKDGRLDHWKVRVEPSSHGAITVSLAASPACGETGAVCTPDGRTFTTALATRIQGPPGLTVADAAVQEAANATLAFAVTLSRAASGTVTVDYATTDASAQAGVDYTATRGTLTFQTGESSKTITVAVLDDVHDEGEETLTLTLANAAGAYLADGTATGRIRNTDSLPQALMARFGRTAAVHVVERVEERMAAPREVGVEAQVAGRQLRPGMARELALDVLRQLGSSAGMHAPGAGPPGARSGSPMGAGAGSIGLAAGMGGPAGSGMGVAADPMNGMARSSGGLFDRGLRSMGLGGEHLLTSSSFALTRETRQGGILSFWSRGARSSFAGREEALSLGGDVRTMMVGADYAKGPLVTGLSLSNSRGLGEYAGVSDGQVASAVTGLYPWLGYTLSDRVSVWGVTGYGKGALTLMPGEGAALTSGLSMAMAAAGTRGALVAGGASGFELAFKADALWVGTSIDGVEGPGGNLTATAAAVTRFRTGLEGARGYTLAGRLSLRPSVEVGLRHDGGDAETGAGLDVGGGLVVSDTSTGLAVDLRVRMLVMHQADGFSERGMALSLSYNPTPSTPLGLTARVAPSWGGEATSGAEAMWGRETMAGMANGGLASGNRLEGEVGYGLPVGSRFVGTPRVGVSTSEYGRDYRIGYGLGVLDRERLNLELGVDAHRRESPMLDGTDNGFLGRATLRW